MAALNIRTRNSDRDRVTDLSRLKRLEELLHQLRGEVENERDGLQSRYDTTQSSAAFALDAFENGGDEHLSDQADSLGSQMKRYQDRMATLEHQKAFLKDIEQTVADFRQSLTAASVQNSVS